MEERGNHQKVPTVNTAIVPIGVQTRWPYKDFYPFLFGVSGIFLMFLGAHNNCRLCLDKGCAHVQVCSCACVRVRVGFSAWIRF